VRYLAILDGTSGAAPRQAQAIGAFLSEGLTGELAGETLVFYEDDRDKEPLVALAPTSEVHLVRTTARRLDRLVEVLTAMAREEATSLFLFAGGPAGTELATRLACRSGGAVLTEALALDAGAERARCRKNVYSNHMVGSFELSRRPWCVSIDASWNDRRTAAALEHRVLSDVDETAGTNPPLFEEVELVGRPAAGDLADSRFLVVAGNGAGSREGVERIAEAARRMGAAFGVSRPVAMNAWAPVERLIGASGARTAPAVCIVAGASGAPAFAWGIERAAFIAAINPDERAPIVRDSDAAVLDDGVAVVEALAEIVESERVTRRSEGDTGDRD
jgi:electron transfer flavoprotein alpha subunit